MWAPVLLFETAGIIVNVCLSFALLPLFFQRRSTFPRAFTITMGIAFGTEVLGMIGDRFIPAVGDSVDSPATFARSTLIGLGWIAYLYKSVTAQETFVHPLPAVEAAPADGLPTSG
jgi:zinc transporter ZupT